MHIQFFTVASEDFMFSDGFSVTFMPSIFSMVTESLNVTIVDDSIIEGDQSFTVNISSISLDSVSVGTPSTVAVTIIDNDRKFIVYTMCNCTTV